MRVVIITNMPSPYRVPLFNSLAKEFKSKGWHLKIVFLTRSYSRRKWEIVESDFEFEYTYLKDFKIVLGEAMISSSVGLFKNLVADKPQLVIVGGFSISALWTLLYCLLFDGKYMIWSGETIDEDRLRKQFRILRNTVRYMIGRLAHGFIVYGTAAKEYLLSKQVNEKKIFVAVNTVDTSFYREASERHRSERAAFIAQHHLPQKNILYVGHLEKRKGADLMLEAVSLVRERNTSQFAVHILGSGPEEENLRLLVKSKKLDHVFFWGFMQKDDIARFFGICDFLVFPSVSELYGLVPIEAMASGLPVLMSNKAGATRDLIKDNVNGVIIDPENIYDFSIKIERFLQNSSLRTQLGSKAESTIRDRFTIRHCTQGFVHAIETVPLRGKD